MAHQRLPLSTKPQHLFIIVVVVCLISRRIDALSFNLSSFKHNQTDITLEGDASINGSSISLNSASQKSVGRALYLKPLQLWQVNGTTNKLAGFTSHFSFQIVKDSSFDGQGHGLAFVLVREDAALSPISYGGLLGLFASEDSGLSDNTQNEVVAVEFDTFKNDWDKSTHHIGIDVNSLSSKAYRNVTSGFIGMDTANVRVHYNSTTRNLNVSLTFTGDSATYAVSYVVDLFVALPARVRVGFTGSTRTYGEIHHIYSWSFNSSLEEIYDTIDTPPTVIPIYPSYRSGVHVALVVGLTMGFLGGILMMGSATFCWFRSRRKVPAQIPMVESPQSPDIMYSGPKRFSYLELAEATKGFDMELKLGEGGFGDVYRGSLADSNEEVAVKRVKSESSQGEKEYVSEINVISTLKHKNLVQLKGWCHDNKELLLVYELMPNKSLDFHLFGESSPLLTWPIRYKITIDLASALHYLQDGCNPYVLHRDIKSSNIMLDSNFIAKLGDFGLARLTNQDQSFQITLPAGTLGYLAPEVLSSQKVSKASDTYSFGVVALEIACGRRPIMCSREDPNIVMSLVKWVWELYGQGSILDAVDHRLDSKFNRDQARRLIMAGLWCCHPDPENRPSIRQVQAVLNFEADEPNVPLVMPTLAYISPLSNLSLPYISLN